MAEEQNNSRSTEEAGITGIRVKGFKSLVEEQSIAIKPLTILAGANSSGKSSIMQPLLLMKQTLEAPYDPGVFKLDGPNVVFSSYREMMPFNIMNAQDWVLAVTVSLGSLTYGLEYHYRDSYENFTILSMQRRSSDRLQVVHEGELDQTHVASVYPGLKYDAHHFYGQRERFALHVKFFEIDGPRSGSALLHHELFKAVAALIHVSGSRKKQARTFPAANVSKVYPGLFEEYAASVIQRWQIEDAQNYKGLNLQLEMLDLTPCIQAVKLGDTKVEVRVAHKGGTTSVEDTPWINIADVGAGVSHVLPVLVAMLAARSGQLVYIEEPELHLHPRAQWRLATIMAETAKRGVRLVIETHSSVLLRGVQTLVAKGELDPELVALHWFTLDPNTGATTVSSAEMDENGAYGDWPEDFDDTALDVEQQYHEAVEKRMFGDG